jgi:hypothetical protein
MNFEKEVGEVPLDELGNATRLRFDTYLTQGYRLERLAQTLHSFGVDVRPRAGWPSQGRSAMLPSHCLSILTRMQRPPRPYLAVTIERMSDRRYCDFSSLLLLGRRRGVRVSASMSLAPRLGIRAQEIESQSGLG